MATAGRQAAAPEETGTAPAPSTPASPPRPGVEVGLPPLVGQVAVKGAGQVPVVAGARRVGVLVLVPETPAVRPAVVGRAIRLGDGRRPVAPLAGGPGRVGLIRAREVRPFAAHSPLTGLQVVDPLRVATPGKPPRRVVAAVLARPSGLVPTFPRPDAPGAGVGSPPNIVRPVTVVQMGPPAVVVQGTPLRPGAPPLELDLKASPVVGAPRRDTQGREDVSPVQGAGRAGPPARTGLIDVPRPVGKASGLGTPLGRPAHHSQAQVGRAVAGGWGRRTSRTACLGQSGTATSWGGRTSDS